MSDLTSKGNSNDVQVPLFYHNNLGWIVLEVEQVE